jgi:hypothetical protein
MFAGQVEEEYLLDGVNKLTIKWPFVYRVMANEPSVSYKGIFKVIIPVICEISSFVASTMGQNSANYTRSAGELRKVIRCTRPGCRSKPSAAKPPPPLSRIFVAR